MGYNPSYAPGPRQNSTTAVISLIAGIVGLTVFPVLGSLIAVITGHIAKGEISRSQGMLGGNGLATWGLVLGYIGLGLTALGLCFGVMVMAGVCTLPFLIPSDSSSLLGWLAGWL